MTSVGILEYGFDDAQNFSRELGHPFSIASKRDGDERRGDAAVEEHGSGPYPVVRPIVTDGIDLVVQGHDGGAREKRVSGSRASHDVLESPAGGSSVKDGSFTWKTNKLF